MRKTSFVSYLKRLLIKEVAPAENVLFAASCRNTAAEFATNVGAGVAPVSHLTVLPTNCVPDPASGPK